MDSLLGEVTLPFQFHLPFLMESTLKGKNLLLMEQILSFRSISSLKAICPPGKG